MLIRIVQKEEALDVAHGLPFARPMKITAGDYDDIVDAAIIVVTAGAGQKPGETRLDLVQEKCSNLSIDHSRDRTEKM